MLEVFFAFALIASAISVNKLLLNFLPPIFFVAIRMFLAGIILFLFSLKKNKLTNKLTIKNIREDFTSIILIVLCATYLPPLLKSYALKYMPSSNVAFFGTLDPFITALYAYLLWSERLSIRKVIGIIISIIGTIIILIDQNSGFFTASSIFYISLPEICAILSLVIGRYGWILVQSLLRKDKYTAIELNAITMTFSGILSLITSSFSENLVFSNLEITQSFVILLLYTIVVGNVISLTIYGFLLKKYSATLLSLAGFSVPLFVQLFGWLFLNETLSIAFFISLGLTFVGFLVFSSDKYKLKI